MTIPKQERTLYSQVAPAMLDPTMKTRRARTLREDGMEELGAYTGGGGAGMTGGRLL